MSSRAQHFRRHRARVIQPKVINDLELSIQSLLVAQKTVFDAVSHKQIDFAQFEAAWATVEKSRT